MTAAISALFVKLLPYLFAGGAALIAILGYGAKQRRAGAAAERAKQAEAEQKARDVADEVQNDVGAMPGNKAREDLKKWSPKE